MTTDYQLVLYFEYYIVAIAIAVAIAAVAFSHSTDTIRAFGVSKCAHAFDIIVCIAPWEDTSIKKKKEAKSKSICVTTSFVSQNNLPVVYFTIYYTGNENSCTDFVYLPHSVNEDISIERVGILIAPIW